jgi:hypothetical protein
MVTCIQFNRPLSLELIQLFRPVLQSFEEGCKQTAEATAIVELAEKYRAELKSSFETYCAQGQPAAETTDLPPPNCSVEEWTRLFYAFDSQLGRFGEKIDKDLLGLHPRLVNGCGECESLRLPCRPLESCESLFYWSQLLNHWISPEAVCLTLTRDAAPWVDALVGRPSPKHFFCLKAPKTELPLTSEIPFEFPEEFKDRAKYHFESIFSRPLVPAPTKAE